MKKGEIYILNQPKKAIINVIDYRPEKGFFRSDEFVKRLDSFTKISDVVFLIPENNKIIDPVKLLAMFNCCAFVEYKPGELIEKFIKVCKYFTTIYNHSIFCYTDSKTIFEYNGDDEFKISQDSLNDIMQKEELCALRGVSSPIYKEFRTSYDKIEEICSYDSRNDNTTTKVANFFIDKINKISSSLHINRNIDTIRKSNTDNMYSTYYTNSGVVYVPLNCIKLILDFAEKDSSTDEYIKSFRSDTCFDFIPSIVNYLNLKHIDSHLSSIALNPNEEE